MENIRESLLSAARWLDNQSLENRFIVVLAIMATYYFLNKTSMFWFFVYAPIIFVSGRSVYGEAEVTTRAILDIFFPIFPE